MSEHQEIGPTPNDDESLARSAFDLPEQLKSFEAHLAAVSPRTDRLDRERLAFLAGQASVSASAATDGVRSSSWRRHPAWPTACAGMSAIAASLLVALVLRSETPRVVDAPRPVYAPWKVSEPDQSKLPSELVLSTRDARELDIDARLDRLAVHHADVDGAGTSSAGA